MDQKQFAIFASALRTYYPKENILPNEQALALWYKQLKDIPYELAEVTLNKWVAVNKWSPSIADIREQALQIQQGDVKSWGDAWGEVLNAIHRYGTYEADKAVNSLDDITRKCVKRLGFYNLCVSENIAVERANFRQIYEQEIERAKQDAQIPQNVKQLINKMPLMLEGAGNEEK